MSHVQGSSDASHFAFARGTGYSDALDALAAQTEDVARTLSQRCKKCGGVIECAVTFIHEGERKVRLDCNVCDIHAEYLDRTTRLRR